MTQRIPVWDIPTRVFHWSLALSFTGAYVTGESERWALVHVTCGYTLLGLIVFRLVWGVAGTRYARFSEFVSGPSSVIRYISGLIQGTPTRYVGHNPAGALAILALLLLGLVSAVSGWMVYGDVDGDWLEKLHEVVSSLMLAIVFVHIAGVLISCRLHGENLVKSMLDGRKQGEENQAITALRPIVALFVLASLIGFWVWSFSDTLKITKAADSVMTAEDKMTKP
ncbi:MAG: cytochrome b/b6 domain-containing protein [Methylobacter sp.]|jgi:cytochrome b|nr:cytochrome b/b6 domain-containing protein [Methylobacter sp.]